MTKWNSYQSPTAALLWSFAMPGFGQFYNKNYFLGIVLMVHEFVVNINSNLNTSLFYTFRGNFDLANQVVDYEWGLFYPSIFCFSLWQAYNRAHTINRRDETGEKAKYVYLTGFFFGMVIGMNFGVNWYESFLTHYLAIFKSPVVSGILSGLIAAFSGHFIEKIIRKISSS